MLKTAEQKVLRLIEENELIGKNEKVLIALSGGADSVFLFHFLLKFKRRLAVQCSAFHLNHKIRGSAAIEDETFCKKLCEDNNIELFIAAKNVKSYAKKNKLSVEEAGRKLRYKELNKIADKKSFDKIATAHNASDNAETVLFNLIKGAGSKGLSGIPVRRDRVIRPLLSLTSDEIRNYLTKKKIEYRLDESNLNIDFERNFIRNEIIPKLKRLNPKAEEKILNSSKIIKGLRASVRKQIETTIKTSVQNFKNGLKINIKNLTEFDETLWNEFLKSAIERNFKIDLSNENLNDLAKLVRSQAGRKVILSNKITAARERGFISVGIAKPYAEKKISEQIKIGDLVKLNGRKVQIENVLLSDLKRTRKKNIEYISADKIKPDFELRSWKEGDRFFPLGMKGSKKISDFLTDEKISSSRKKEHLVLINNGKIVWVVGLRIDDRFKVTSKTKKVIKLSCK
jgi:tRNA(Ile)-lysidine synthase